MMRTDDLSREVSLKYTAREESEIFKIAVENVNMHVFVCDIPLHKLYFFESKTYPFGVLKGSEHTVQDIIDLNMMDEETISVFTSLFQRIEDGEKSADAIIKICSGKAPRWNHIMLINHFNEEGAPVRAVGTIQDVSHRVEMEQLYTNEKQFRLAMLADSRRVYEINVTRDRFIKLESIQDTTDCGLWDKYTSSMAELCKTLVYREDWDAFLKIATRENLIQGFDKGITEFHCEYRVVDEDGHTAWSSSTTHLLKDPVSNDIKGFIYVKDIDKQKELELQLYQQAESDPLTGIYNRRTAERLITEILLASGPEQLHGFLSLDIDDFKHVNDAFGHIKGDFLLQQLSCDIRKILRHKDVFARMGGDEFIVFLNDVDTIPSILDVANRLCECVSQICVHEKSDYYSTISIGISTFPSGGNTFAELYKNSDRSLYDVKQHGKNGISLFTVGAPEIIHISREE